jgi:hypothetical protein
MGLCFRTLGTMLDDKKATLIARGQKCADGKIAPTKPILGGSKLDAFEGNYEIIEGIKTVTCDFNKVVPIKEEDNYTSSDTTGKNSDNKQQTPG